jgi:NAD(P)-dependent dehydrogenase (short-subunit alcohol dehydrogenase family)
MVEEGLARFEDDVVVVTGSTRGIGAETARRFGAEGAAVVVSGRTVEDGEAVADDVRAAGGEAVFVETDLADPDDVAALFEATVAEFGGLDVLVNNAAVQTHGTVAGTTLEEWQFTVDVNLRAPWLCARHAVDHIEEGSVVNVSSNHAVETNPGSFPYNALKGSVHGLTQALAVECGPEIRANTVSPGWTRVREATTEAQREHRREVGELHPVGRMGLPEDVAGVIAFLASDDAAFVTGADLLADGGRGAVMYDHSLLDYRRSGEE